VSGRISTLVGLVALGLCLAFAWALDAASWPRADLSIGNGPDPRSLDPALLQSAADARVAGALFEGLVAAHPRTLEPTPALAASWSRVDEGRTWRFTLHQDLVWSDGVPIRAPDLVWSFLRFLDPATGARLGDLLDLVEGARDFRRGQGPVSSVGIAAPDDHTLVFRLVAAAPYFLDVLCLFPLFPVPRHAVERHGARWVRPGFFVGSGPYVLEEWRLRDRVRVRRNPRYRQAAEVAFEVVDFRVADNPATLLNLFITGDADWVTDVPPPAVPALLARRGPAATGEFRPAPRLGTFFFRVNCTRPPFTNPRIRRALSLAIDRAAIVRTVTRAGESPAFSLVPPGVRAGDAVYEPPRECGLDFEQARSLLAQGLREEGLQSLPRFEVLYSPEPGDQPIAEVLEAAWRGLGVSCRLVTQDGASIRDALRRLDYTVARSSWLGDYNDPSTFLDQYRTGSPGNRTGWTHAGYDRLLEEAAAAEGAARRSLLAAAERILLEESPILPVYHYVSRNLVRRDLGGFHENVMDWHPIGALFRRSPR
jgi:oligopeptide transport system substrate-binding protein